MDTWSLPKVRPISCKDCPAFQRLRIPVDTAFLDEMTQWREELAKNVYKNNPELTAKQLNEVVQRLLDRIVLIRIAEDRRVIEKNQLRDAVEEWKARGG